MEETPKKLIKIKGKRSTFNIKKDISLLRTVLGQNPWQLGEEGWSNAVFVFNSTFNAKITVRTAKQRVNLLLDKYQKQLLETKTGTEEEITERGSLLEEIVKLIEEDEPINIEIGADCNLGSGSDGEEVITEPVDVNHQQPKSSRKHKEKQDADVERDKLLAKPDKKKRRYCAEDEMIMKKQEHDIFMDTERIELEKQKLELERMKEERVLEENRRRDERLLEEGRRRDEIAASQATFQNQLLQIMSKLVEK